MQGRDGNRRARRRHGSVCSRRSESKRDGAAAGTRALRVLSEAVPVRLSGERGRGARSADAWAKVSLAALSGRDPDASAALAFAGCTGCDRCAQHCAHDNDVPAMLFAARATAVRAGVAPPPWSDLALRFAARGHGETGDLGAVRRSLPVTRGEATLLAGCEALSRGGQEGR